MSRLTLCTYRELAAIAETQGFHWIRRKGSHNVFRNSLGTTSIIADHGSTQLSRSLPRKILCELDVSPEEYSRLLEEL